MDGRELAGIGEVPTRPDRFVKAARAPSRARQDRRMILRMAGSTRSSPAGSGSRPS